jgi:ABC-type transporter Mla subunit MlaD
MSNSWDPDGRGPSDKQLLTCGLTALLVVAAVVASLVLKATGRLTEYVRVVADLANVGDGLPQRSDVKYHGLPVGTVDDVITAAYGKPNYVHIDLKPQYVKDIPSSVTARVVPANIFAVSTLELVDHGAGGSAIGNGAHIPENTDLPTVIFQTTITKLREIIAATARGGDDHSVGILAAVEAATENRGTTLLHSGAQMTRLLGELNAIVASEPGPSTVSELLEATRGLQSTAPELVDALHEAVKPMQTFVEQRAQFTSLVTGSQHTFGISQRALDNHTDQLIQITHNLTPVLGVFALNADKFVPIFTRLKRLSDKFLTEMWDPDREVGNMRINFSLTPTYSYTRADCPQYGQLKGPSCFTAPVIPVRPDLPKVLLPQNYQPPADLAPPPGTAIGDDGNLVAIGPPLLNPHPNLADPNPPLPVWLWPIGPAPRVPGTADPADGPSSEPSLGPPQPADTPQPGPQPTAGVAPASYGGNVGPVGSQLERDQLGVITGQAHPASVATQLLLGPVARGTTVSLTAEPSGSPK